MLITCDRHLSSMGLLRMRMQFMTRMQDAQAKWLHSLQEAHGTLQARAEDAEASAARLRCALADAEGELQRLVARTKDAEAAAADAKSAAAEAQRRQQGAEEARDAMAARQTALQDEAATAQQEVCFASA